MAQEPWGPVSPNPPRATAKDFETAARQIGCTPAEIRAVWKVEAAGRPYRADGTVERRFEPHHYPKNAWPKIGFSVRQGEAPWRASLRLSNEAMFQRAANQDKDAAIDASSWGAPQIMAGMNHQAAGHVTGRSMVQAMARNEGEHLKAFTTLVNNWGLSSAIRAHDWERFARRYNGPGQVKHYAGLLERAFAVTSTQKHAAALEAATRSETGAASRVVLRLGSEGSAVAKLQRALEIKDDRVFGVNTEAAVREYQKANGLAVDGVVGERTWRSLDAQGALVEVVETQPATTAEKPVTGIAALAAPATIVTGAAASAGWVNAAAIAAVAVVVIAAFIWWRGRE